MFICTWITVNLSFPAMSMVMSTDHKFRVETKDGYNHIVFFHPENEEHEHHHGYIHDQDHHSFRFSYEGQSHHEHDFQLASADYGTNVTDNILLKIDAERTPPLDLINEAFNFIPRKYSPFRYYKYPLRVNTTSLSLKTTVLLI